MTYGSCGSCGCVSKLGHPVLRPNLRCNGFCSFTRHEKCRKDYCTCLFCGGSKDGKTWKDPSFTIQDLCPRSYVLYNPLAIICSADTIYIYIYLYAYDIMICCISNRWYMVDTYVIGPQSISFGWRNRAWVCPGFQKWLAAWSTRPSTTESSCNRFQSQWSLRIHPLVYTGSQATQAQQRLDQGLKEVPSQWSDQAVARRDVGAGC